MNPAEQTRIQTQGLTHDLLNPGAYRVKEERPLIQPPFRPVPDPVFKGNQSKSKQIKGIQTKNFLWMTAFPEPVSSLRGFLDIPAGTL